MQTLYYFIASTASKPNKGPISGDSIQAKGSLGTDTEIDDEATPVLDSVGPELGHQQLGARQRPVVLVSGQRAAKLHPVILHAGVEGERAVDLLGLVDELDLEEVLGAPAVGVAPG